MTSQFTFNNKKSYDDFNLTLVNVEVGYPSVNTITHSIPYMNGNYDFSNLFGCQTYSNRQVILTLGLSDLIDFSRTRHNLFYDSVINWLFNGAFSTLEIDYISYYFKGRVIEITPLEEFLNSEMINVTFDCYPFRIDPNFEGNDIWDTFNFELDIAQTTAFSVEANQKVTLHNASATPITPKVYCANPFTVVKDDVSYSFNPGETIDYRFSLKIGENELELKGDGMIEFKFQKEVI